MPQLIPFILAVLASGGGNLLLKAGVLRIDGIDLTKESSIFDLIKIFTNPFIVAGLLGYVAGFFLWLKVLSTTEVSRAYPALVSSSIILVLLGSSLFFKEQLSFLKVFGVIVIILGIYLVFKS